jgi:hypothetical protein
MAEYLARLVQRLNQPSTGDPPQPMSIAPFVPAAGGGAGPEDSLEEVIDLPIAETTSFKPAPAGRDSDQPPSRAAESDYPGRGSQPAGTTLSTAPPAARNTAELIPNPVPVTPDVSSTRVPERPTAEPSESDDYPLNETQHPTRTILVETDLKSASAPDAMRTPFDLPVSSQPGLSNQDEKAPRQEKSEPRALETRKDPIAPIFQDPLTESITPKKKQPSEDLTTQAYQLPVQGETQPPPQSAEPKEIPTLHPSPRPSPPETRPPERPRLVIGRLHVEVVPPPKESPPASSTAKPARHMPTRTPGRHQAHSKLRFGLGQL